MSKSKNGGVFSRPVDRRTFLAFTAGAGVAATGFSTGALAQANKTGVDPTKWTPEYIKSIAGTAEYDTAAECDKVVPKDYKGRLTYWYFGPNQASPQIEHDIDEQFWEAFKATLPEHSGHALNLNYNEMLDKLRTAASARRRRWSCACRFSGASSSRPRASCMEFGPEEVGYPRRRVLAGRDEVGHLERQDLRRADQQRDDGADLERRALQGGRARSGDSRRRPGTKSSPTPSRSRTRPARTATAWLPASMPATRRSASCPSLGIRRRRARRGRAQPDLQEDLHQQ